MPIHRRVHAAAAGLLIAACLAASALAGGAEDIAKGRDLLRGPQHAQGVKLIEGGIAALSSEDATADSWHQIGMGHFHLQHDAEAVAAFDKAAGLAPKDASHPFMRGIVLMYSDLPAAEKAMRKAVELAPEEATNRFELARILRLQHKLKEAVAPAVKATELDPKAPQPHTQAAGIFVALGETERALAHYREALGLAPDHPTTLYNAGKCAYDLAEFSTAKGYWVRGTQLAPDDWGMFRKAVQAHYALGEFEAAEPFRARIFELRKTDADLAKQSEFCFDQFRVGEHVVFAYESFDKTGDLYYHFTFKVLGEDDSILGTVNLESSAFIREMGVPYLLGGNRGPVHKQYRHRWKELPPYAELKPLVIATIESEYDED